MRKIKEVLRLTWACNQSQRQVARQCCLSRPCVRNYLRRADEAGLSWPLPADLDDDQLERLLFPAVPKPAAVERIVPDWPAVFTDLKQKNVTKFLLWQRMTVTWRGAGFVMLGSESWLLFGFLAIWGGYALVLA